MNHLTLDGKDWQLIYVANETLVHDGFTSDLDELRRRGYQEINAAVPGNLEVDLMNAGRLEDPFYGRNARNRFCEYLHCFYFRTFFCDDTNSQSLVFEGLDTIADIYLNGQLAGRADNMLIPHEFDASPFLKKGENTLLVHIKPAVIEARKYPLALHDSAMRYNSEALYIRKAPHMYGWDIFPRIVSAGIWRPVYVAQKRRDSITEAYLAATGVDVAEKAATIHYLINTDLVSDDILRYSVDIQGVCGTASFHFSAPLMHSSLQGDFSISNARFWWPRTVGMPSLYDVTVRLLKDGKETDSRQFRLGVRTIELDRTSVTDKDGRTGRFHFIVNGKPVFCMGTNWVPIDSLHSRDAKRLPHILPMLTDINCNIIRVWGGGVYEHDDLYSFCDENGIMVWQDFMMGCATYPQDDGFAEKIAIEATAVVKKLRQHPSIALWAGNNENDSAYIYWARVRRDPNNDRISRQVLPHIVWMHDYIRPYIPSSPYYDEKAFSLVDSNELKVSEDHLWGPRDYFKGDFYRTSICQFASETGYHGCNSPASIRKFIPDEFLWTAQDNTKWTGLDNPFWLAHASTIADDNDPFAYRIRLMADQVSTLFGTSVPNTLADFARASQISQAEAKKYFIERFRVSKMRRSGIIWWNLIDGCPQFSDAVVDYYFCKKLAYHYIKRSQQYVCLICDEPRGDILPLHTVSELPEDKVLKYKVTDITAGRVVADGTVTAKADSSVRIFDIPASEGEKHFYFIEWKMDGQTFSNHFMTGLKDIDYAEYLKAITTCGYADFEGF